MDYRILKVVEYNDKYIPQIIDMHMKSFKINDDNKYWTHLSFLNQLAQKNESIYIMIDITNDKVIARADLWNKRLYSFDDNDKYNTIYLFNFCRIDDVKYKGAGKILLDFLFDHYANVYAINNYTNNYEPLTNMKLLVEDNNQKLINYYKGFGFVEIDLPDEVYSVLERKNVKISNENSITYGPKTARIFRRELPYSYPPVKSSDIVIEKN